MRKREHDRYWAGVYKAGINCNPVAGAAEWIHLRWGMGVSPEADGAGGKGVMRKRARDKGRGTQDTDKEKAGGRGVCWSESTEGETLGTRTSKHTT
jgi:hypothetical protein